MDWNEKSFYFDLESWHSFQKRHIINRKVFIKKNVMYSTEIKNLQGRIKQSQETIKKYRAQMAQHRVNKSPKHYQESGKRNIESEKKQIQKHKDSIAELRNKKKSMGKGVDSFKRELGKNTGKWVSNKVFGDGHSTPHRVTIKRDKQLDKNENIKDNNKNILSKGKEYFSDNDDIKEEISNVTSKKNEIVSTIIPSEKDAIMNLVYLLLSTIKSNGWKSGENEKHINSLSDACLIKLEQCEIKLKSQNDFVEATYIENEIKKLKKKKFIQKYLIFVGFALFALIMFILYQLGLIK